MRLIWAKACLICGNRDIVNGVAKPYMSCQGVKTDHTFLREHGNHKIRHFTVCCTVYTLTFTTLYIERTALLLLAFCTQPKFSIGTFLGTHFRKFHTNFQEKKKQHWELWEPWMFLYVKRMRMITHTYHDNHGTQFEFIHGNHISLRTRAREHKHREIKLVDSDFIWRFMFFHTSTLCT